MATGTVLGLPIEIGDLVQPMEAVVAVKGLDANGDYAYFCNKTNDLHPVEALGLIEFAGERLRMVIRSAFTSTDGAGDE